MSVRTHYEALGVGRAASGEDIRRAYKKKAMLYHPDKNRENVEEATALFRLVAEAYEVLSSPATKAAYDTTLRRPSVPAARAPASPQASRPSPARRPAPAQRPDEDDGDDECDHFSPSVYSVDRAFDLFDMLFAGMDSDPHDPWGDLDPGAAFDGWLDDVMLQAMEHDMHSLMMFSALMSMSHGLGGVGAPEEPSGHRGTAEEWYSSGGRRAGGPNGMRVSVHVSSSRPAARDPVTRPRAQGIPTDSVSHRSSRVDKIESDLNLGSTPPQQRDGARRRGTSMPAAGSTMSDRTKKNYVAAEVIQSTVSEARSQKRDSAAPVRSASDRSETARRKGRHRRNTAKRSHGPSSSGGGGSAGPGGVGGKGVSASESRCELPAIPGAVDSPGGSLMSYITKAFGLGGEKRKHSSLAPAALG